MDDNFETLETYWSLAEAQLNKNLLETESIPCFLQGEAASGMLWHLSSATGGVRLQVRQSDLPRAARVLQSGRGTHAAEIADVRQSRESLDDSTEVVDAEEVQESRTQIAEVDSGDVTDADEDVDDSYDADDDDLTERPGVLDKFRSIRYLIIVPFLCFTLYGFCLLVMAVLSWMVTGPSRF